MKTDTSLTVVLYDVKQDFVRHFIGYILQISLHGMCGGKDSPIFDRLAYLLEHQDLKVRLRKALDQSNFRMKYELYMMMTKRNNRFHLNSSVPWTSEEGEYFWLGVTHYCGQHPM